jgi:hypothetical protein
MKSRLRAPIAQQSERSSTGGDCNNASIDKVIMNNESFQRLVRERAGMHKSTKEIAREAVEAEFKKIGGNKRHRDVDSSDDDDNDKKNSQSTNRNNDKKMQGSRSKTMDPSELEPLGGKYRDRVKERREGISADFDEIATLNSSVADQIFDDVVEALESGDRRQLARISSVAHKDSSVSDIPMTFDDALTWIAQPKTMPHSTLGKDVLSYLRKAYIIENSNTILVSAAGRNIQQSVMSFTKAINADPRDRQRSWECPLEQTFGADTTTNLDSPNDGNEYCIKKATLCNSELLKKMQDCFDMRERGTARNEGVSNISMLTGNVPDGTPQMNLSNEADEDENIFASVGEYDGAGVDVEEYTDNISTKTNDALV